MFIDHNLASIPVLVGVLSSLIAVQNSSNIPQKAQSVTEYNFNINIST